MWFGFGLGHMLCGLFSLLSSIVFLIFQVSASITIMAPGFSLPGIIWNCASSQTSPFPGSVGNGPGISSSAVAGGHCFVQYGIMSCGTSIPTPMSPCMYGCTGQK